MGSRHELTSVVRVVLQPWRGPKHDSDQSLRDKNSELRSKTPTPAAVNLSRFSMGEGEARQGEGEARQGETRRDET